MGIKLWDEILKAIVSTMPSQLFPLFKEVYGREYPKNTSVTLLESETSSFLENRANPLTSTFMDISLLVAGTDYYHLECQMKNEKEMVSLFIPYTILRLRPKLAPNIAYKLTHKELTEFVEKAIVVLKEEMDDGYLTELEFRDYVRLFQMAADRVLAMHSQMREEVYQMTEPMIKLPSMIEKELRAELQVEIAEQKIEIKEHKAEILVNQLTAGKPVS